MNHPESVSRSPKASPAWFANAHLLLSFATLCWAANAIAGKLAADEMTPITLTFLRWLGCSAVLLVLAWPHLRADWDKLRRNWGRVFVLGSTGFALFNLTYYWALNYTTAINVSIEQGAMPAIIIAANFVLFRQNAHPLQLIGMLVTMTGVVVTVTHGDPGAILEASLNRGDALMLLAMLFYSGYAVGLRYRPAMHWLSLLFGMAIAALLTISPFLVFEAINQGISLPGWRGWLIVGFVVLFPSLVAQLFFMRSVELIGANRAAVFINLVPIFGAVLAIGLLHEPIEAYHGIGLALVVGGIGVAERFAAPVQRPSQKARE